MLSLLIAAIALTPVQLQIPEVMPAQSYCVSVDCGRSFESITPQSSPECADVCPRGNSGQPEESIGK